MEIKEIKFNEIEVLDIVEITTDISTKVLGIVVEKSERIDLGEVVSSFSVLITEDRYFEFMEKDVQSILFHGKYELNNEEAGIEQ